MKKSELLQSVQADFGLTAHELLKLLNKRLEQRYQKRQTSDIPFDGH